MDADELYGLPLERFVAERGALARSLRAEGRREEAAALTALRKPSVAAWAVNQLVRTQGAAVAELFEAGDALRKAHERVLSGRGEGGTLRAALERERAAVETLIGAARGLLSTNGHELSEAVIERVADTLHAAALDDDARKEVQRATLVRELRHVGLGLAGGTPAARPARRRAPNEKAKARRQAQATESGARRRAERAARAAQEAQVRRDRALDALQAAEEALSRLLAEAQQAADEHRRAQERLAGM
jgi:hypothetical protein